MAEKFIEAVLLTEISNIESRYSRIGGKSDPVRNFLEFISRFQWQSQHGMP